MNLNSIKHETPRILETLTSEVQEFQDCVLNGKIIPGMEDKVKKVWNGVATFLSSVSLGAAAGTAASLSPWAISSLSPLVTSAAVTLGLTINPATTPLIIGVGIGLGVTIVAAVLISGVVKINRYLAISRAEKELKAIKNVLDTHKIDFGKWHEFDYSVDQGIYQSKEDRRYALNLNINHAHHMINDLKDIATKSENVTKELNKKHAVIKFSCHEMMREYAAKLEEIQQQIMQINEDLDDLNTDKGIAQTNQITPLIENLYKLETEYQDIRDQRIRFFGKQIVAQEQYVQVLKAKLQN